MHGASMCFGTSRSGFGSGSAETSPGANGMEKDKRKIYCPAIERMDMKANFVGIFLRTAQVHCGVKEVLYFNCT